MGKRLFRSPSLRTLRVFVATAQRLSFTRAAAELHVTQAAVSRHIRQLEAALGKPLFVRLHRRVELTLAGQQLSEQLTHSFDAIAQAIEATRDKQRQLIRLSVEPAFAARWLLPRIPRFLRAHIDIDVEIESTETLREIGLEADLAIRFVDHSRPHLGPNAALLTEITAFPVLAPSLPRADKPLLRPGDLLQYPLLHEDDGRYWHRWFTAAGIKDIEVPRRMRLNDVALVLQAAAGGQGVALGDELLAGDDLRSGRLLKPFDLEVRCGTYWFVWGSGALSSAQRAFHDWLRQELPAR